MDEMDQTPQKATRQPRSDSMRNRERLLAAAKEVFSTGGAGASLEAVARQAGLGIGTLYRHFPTRDALFEAVYRREVDQLAELAGHLNTADEPGEALRRWLHEFVAVVATKKGMLANLALPVEGRGDLYAHSSRQTSAAVDMLLRRGVAAGAIRDDITGADIVRAVVGFCHSGGQVGWQAGVLRLVDVFVDGLQRRPSSSQG